MADGPQAERAYIRAVQQRLATGDATEHTYRPALQAFLESLDSDIVAVNEARRIQCGAPDLTVGRQAGHGLRTLGYVEAKDVGADLGAIERDSGRASPATPEGQQLKRYREALDNLVLTDYLEFRWYVHGQRRGDPVRLAEVEANGRLRPTASGSQAVLALLSDFLAHQGKPIGDPRELAQRMARLTHLIRDMVVEAFQQGTASLTTSGLRDAFAEVLIPDLSVNDFADMYSQTLAYGLFAARVQHDSSRGPFLRRDASYEIPRTNPFLRRLFDQIAGPDLDDEPFAGLVDDLAQLLAETDMGAVLSDFGKRTRQEDPVVHFYETFLAAYDPRLQEMRGVYYTPEPVVSYIVRSVDQLLRTRFDCPDGLGDTSTASYQQVNDAGQEVTEHGPRVLVLDPACGTGTFLYSVVDHIRGQFMARNDAGRWSGYVRDGLLPRLFGFELLMAPYAVAHLKLGMQLAALDLPEERRADWAYDFSGQERLGVYLTNTLEEALRRSEILLGRYISEEANAAAKVKRDRPVLVVLGNPPYSGHSANASTRKVEIKAGTRYKKRIGGKWDWVAARRDIVATVPTFIGELMDDYYWVDGQPLGERNPKWLQDDYVKFLRFGQWRIEKTGEGVLAFICNNGYLDNPTFRGMRQHLMSTFTDIYILDLHGNSRKGERAPDGSPDENVFDIQQGVTIGIFVKEEGREGPARVHHADLWGEREGKYGWLLAQDLTNTPWTPIAPQPPYYLFTVQDLDLASEYGAGWKVPNVFPTNSVGIVTARDHLTIHWTPRDILNTVKDFVGLSEDEARRKYHLGNDARDWKVSLAQADIRASGVAEDRIARILYRPFDCRYTYYTGRTRGFICMPRSEVMRHLLKGPNLGLITSRLTKGETFKHVQVGTNVVEVICMSPKTSNNGFVFPLYLYPAHMDLPNGRGKRLEMLGLSPWPEGKDGRRPNLSPEFVRDLEQRLGLAFTSDGRGDLEQTFGPEDVFHYIYAVLHSPEYRSRYSEFLKIDFPRIPLTSNLALFRALAEKGADLVSRHLLESPAVRRRVLSYPVTGDNVVESGHPRYVAPGPTPGSDEPLERGRVYISKDNARGGKRGQYFEGVPPEVWEFQVGGYQVCDKWLKDRRGRALTNADIEHYERVVVALQETIRLMAEIDDVIEEHGSWPLE